MEVQQPPTGGVSLHSILGTQERGWAMTGHKPESTELLYQNSPLQNGGSTYPEGSTATQRLLNKSRPERHVLHDPDTPEPQEVPAVLSPRQSVPVHLPSLQSFLGTIGVYLNSQACGSFRERTGLASSVLYKRHPANGRVIITTVRTVTNDNKTMIMAMNTILLM